MQKVLDRKIIIIMKTGIIITISNHNDMGKCEHFFVGRKMLLAVRELFWKQIGIMYPSGVRIQARPPPVQGLLQTKLP